MPRRGTWLIIGLLLVAALAGGALLFVLPEQCVITYTINDKTVAFVAPPLDATCLDPNFGPYTYSWDFGDFKTAQTSSPSISHTYASYQFYNIVLTAQGTGAPRIYYLTINLQPGFVIPLDASFDVSGVGLTRTFSAQASGGTAPYRFSWNFGDGATGSQNPMDHTYAAEGTYTIGLSVHDNAGGAKDVIKTVQVSKPPAQVEPLVAQFSYTAHGLTVDVTGKCTGGVSPYTYIWDFGDGSGTARVPGTSIYTFTYKANGVYTIKLVCADSVNKQSDPTSLTLEFKGGQPVSPSGNSTPTQPSEFPVLYIVLSVAAVVIVAVFLVRRRLF